MGSVEVVYDMEEDRRMGVRGPSPLNCFDYAFYISEKHPFEHRDMAFNR